jgi:hypothetical protein
MSITSGPKIIDDGLVFYIDATNKNSISALGNASFNNAPEVIRSLISGVTVNSYNGINVGNLNYYTVFAIDYPEGSYGGDAAGRHGMTPGLNVRSGTKTYDSSRSLHMWVWNNETNSWLASSFFNGYRLSGHCYDNYTYAEDGYLNQINKFITDFNNIKKRFTNCTYIITGSHRADQYNSGLRAILYDLGMPTGTALDSDYVAAPEWILVGKPGLGAGNAYGWVYQNYTTNAAQVAHLNFGLPIYGNSGNYLTFDGVDNYINTGYDLSWNNTNSATISLFVKPATTNSSAGIIGKPSPDWEWAIMQDGTNLTFVYWNTGGGHTNGPVITLNNFFNSTENWINITLTWSHTDNKIRIYKNGILLNETTWTDASINQNRTNSVYLGGGIYTWSTGYWSGSIANVSLYNKALTTNEVVQNFEAKRKKYNI